MIIDTADRLKTTKEYYFSIKLQEVRKLISDGKDVINIAIGNPDMAPTSKTVDKLYKSALNPAHHGYQPYRSIPELRLAITKWYNHVYKVKLDYENEILPLIGSKEGITHISLAFLNPGDEVLIPELGYPAYRAVTEMIGGKAIEYSMSEKTGWQPDIKALYKQDLSKVKLMWLNYPNMPTGAPANRKVFENLIEFARHKKILLCHDNPYSLILNENEPISILSIKGALEVALELNSMSKSHNMAGWRIGWAVAGKPYIDEIIKIKSNVDSGMFRPMQLAAVEALSNPDSWHEARNLEYRERRDIVYKILNLLGCTYNVNQSGLFIWALIPDSISSSKSMSDYLLYHHDIFIAPGFIFGPKGDRYIRLSLCVPKETLKKVLARLKNFNIHAT